jgi:serine protease
LNKPVYDKGKIFQIPAKTCFLLIVLLCAALQNGVYATPDTTFLSTEIILRLRSSDDANDLLRQEGILSKLLPAQSSTCYALPFRSVDDKFKFKNLISLVNEKGFRPSFPAKLMAMEEVIWAEFRQLRICDTIPNDSQYAELWALPRVMAPAAWDIQTGSADIVIAVVDTGIDLEHPDLSPAIWENSAEINGVSGHDDDGNGWADDFYGWDFRDADADPNPEAGDSHHGTHVAGTAGAVTNNSIGVASIAWNTSLMAIRSGHGSVISHGPEGIWYAASSGADIINCSWGLDSPSYYEQEAVRAATDSGSLVIAAAGNSGDTIEHYPAAYSAAIAVASTNANDSKATGSKYGYWVDVAAPGAQILSTYIGGGYGIKSGTSMACPQVSSLAALIKSQHPGYDVANLAAHLTHSCDPIDDINPQYSGQLGSGRINAFNAVGQTPDAIALESWEVSDQNQDDVIDPGETVELILNLRALSGSFDPLSATVQIAAGSATVLDADAAFGPLIQGQSANNSADPFELLISPVAPHGQEILILIDINAADYQLREWVKIRVAPTFASLDQGNIEISLTGDGGLGFYDYDQGEQIGHGMIWPDSGPNHLWTGSLLIALDDGRVMDMVSYINGNSGDFNVLPDGQVRLSQFENSQSIVSTFTDSAAANPAGLLIETNALSTSLEARDDIIICSYTIHNTSEQSITIQPGAWLDFDVNGDWADDMGGWNDQFNYSWQDDAEGAYLAVKILAEETNSFRLCRWSDWQSGGLDDAELSDYMTQGFLQTESDTEDDWQICLSAESQTLQAGASRQFAFALLAGSSTDELDTKVVEADLWWESVDSPRTNNLPQDFLLLDLYPNPFNPTTILHLELARNANISWNIYDILGRQILSAKADFFSAGSHQILINLAACPSGKYFLEVESDRHRIVKPLLLLK